MIRPPSRGTRRVPARRRAALAALLLGILAWAAPARAGELSAEEQRFARTCLDGLGANSPRVRKASEDALARLGTDVLPMVADALPQMKGEAAKKGLRRALEAMGRDAVIAELDRLAQGVGKAQAKRYEDVAALLGAGPAAAANPDAGPIPLAVGRLEDPSLAPLEVEREVRGRLPADWTASVHSVRAEGGKLLVDSDGDGAPDATLGAGEARVVEVGASGRRVALLLYPKADAWWACPATVLRGSRGGRSIEFLDADLDGVFDGAEDWVRSGDGAFGRLDPSRRILLGDEVVVVRLVPDGPGMRLDSVPEAPPAGASEGALASLRALNRWRRSVGVAPAVLDVARCDACAKHAAYLQRNAGTPATAGLRVHEEQANLPGWTREGAEAAGATIVTGNPDPAGAIGTWSLTMLHGTDLLGAPKPGFGIGAAAGRGGASVLWGADPTSRDGRTPLVVPAPGQRGVPVRGGAEEPAPDAPANWYGAPRGFPVSVFHAGLGLRRVEIRLVRADGGAPVPGALWNDERPITGRYGAGVAFFMPSAPLERGAAYLAIASAEGATGPRRWAWTFRTD